MLRAKPMPPDAIPPGTTLFDTLTPTKVGSHGSVWTNQEILWRIVQYLPVVDLCRFSGVSRRCREAACDSELWLRRIQNVGLEDKVEEPKHEVSTPAAPGLIEMMATTTLASSLTALNAFSAFKYSPQDPRKGCVELFRALAPLYYDLVTNPSDPQVFHAYSNPVEQARVLRHLKRFSQFDPVEDNHDDNLTQLEATISLFENAALGEFEAGIDANALDKVKTYVAVLVSLNGGDSCIQLYTQKHPLVDERPDPKTFFKGEEDDKELDLDKLHSYLQGLVTSINDESARVDSVFPTAVPVITPLFDRILEDNVMELVSSVMTIVGSSEGKKKYLGVVPDVYAELVWFSTQLKPSANSGPNFNQTCLASINDFYSLYISTFLDEELQQFAEYADGEVTKFRREILDEEAATETFLWSNVAKEKDKSAFLSSFKRVFMMPVNAITYRSENNSSTSVASGAVPGVAASGVAASGVAASGVVGPSGAANGTHLGHGQAHSGPLPHTELDAMVAVMNNKLEGIKTLFSLELAVNLLREAKESIERMGKFASMSTTAAVDGTGVTVRAKQQCEAVFVELVYHLGERHIKGGFDKALDTLNQYDPKQHRRTVAGSDDGEERDAVEPLAIFAELVNIGDLIQQMIHVFFEEELAHKKYVDRTDFVAAGVKAKKKFEQMLDDSVANGLSRGIDVLIDQVDFLFVTVQLGSDYNPLALSAVSEVGPTTAAQKVVTLLSSHMMLLVGSTEKSVLDVFQQEVGLRFFGSICKHLKRQTVSVDGAIRLISDMNFYYNFVVALRQRELLPYFAALKEVGQLFLIDGRDSKALGATLSDMVRFRNIFKAEELVEFVHRRQDWLVVRRDVEKAMYGFGECLVM